MLIVKQVDIQNVSLKNVLALLTDDVLLVKLMDGGKQLARVLTGGNRPVGSVEDDVHLNRKRVSIQGMTLNDVLALLSDEYSELLLVDEEKQVARFVPDGKRIAGLFEGRGEFWMSDDFNEPLDDFREYME